MGLLGEPTPPPQKQLLARIGDFFVPDILSRRKAPSKRLGPTAWLDGLRGWAAMCVVFMHLTAFSHDGIEICYGQEFKHKEGFFNNSPAALPIIRLPFTGGHFSVMLFFVISGYVVPRRLLQHLHEGRRQEFLDDIQSSLFRRPIRLFLPVILSTIVIFTGWHVFGLVVTPLPKQANIFLEAWRWVQETSAFVFFFKAGWLYTYYNVHTWTIPIEMRGSMFIFVFLIIVNTLKTKHRVLMTTAMLLHLAIGCSGATYACFFGGMLLSDLELVGSDNKGVTFPWDGIDKWLRNRKPTRNLVLHLLLIADLYLATQPNTDWTTRAETLGNCPGWKTLGALIPPSYWDADSQFRWFWLFWAAFLMVYLVREIDWLRRWCEGPAGQYLGRHSFALYLVHGPCITWVADKLFHLLGVKQMWAEDHIPIYGWYQNKLRDAPWWPLPDGGYYALEPNFLFCAAVCIPFILYVAEIGTRAFDIPSVKVSKWAWAKWQSM